MRFLFQFVVGYVGGLVVGIPAFVMSYPFMVSLIDTRAPGNLNQVFAAMGIDVLISLSVAAIVGVHSETILAGKLYDYFFARGKQAH